MTSFMISAHIDRKISDSWKLDHECVFCRIIAGTLPAHRVYEDDMTIAVLGSNILPLRPGHTLVIPKIHCSRLTELPEEYAAALGVAVSRVGNALTLALDNTALNVVANQEYAQAVFHVHYHVIPAPNLIASNNTLVNTAVPRPTAQEPPNFKDVHRLEREGREELEDDSAAALVELIKARL